MYMRLSPIRVHVTMTITLYGREVLLLLACGYKLQISYSGHEMLDGFYELNILFDIENLGLQDLIKAYILHKPIDK